MAGIVVTELGSERKYRVPDSETFGGLDHSGVQKSIQAARTASAAKNMNFVPYRVSGRSGFVAPVMPLEVKTPDIRVKRQPLHVHDLYSQNFPYQPGFSRVNYF